MIKPETIALVKERTDIVALIGESITLKRRGRSFVGLCPFHKEKTPSFYINPDRGFFYCFGCNEGGSAVDFVMKHDGMTFPEAVRMLADRAGIVVEQDTAFESGRDLHKRDKEDLYAVMQLAATYFEEQLREHPERRAALEELSRRGLAPGTDPKVDDVLQAFRIGYAPAGWDNLASFLRKHGISPITAEQAGLVAARSGGGHYDRFRQRLMFPVMDVQGRVVAFSGRALPVQDPQPGGEPPPKYINSPESPIYHKGSLLFGLFQARHAIRRQEVAVLVEGNFDVVSLHARGIDNVCAPLGTAFTTEQARLLRRFAPRVIVFFDADAAGRKATRAAREPCREAGLKAQVASPPHGMDPDELVRQKGPQALFDLLKSARGMLEHLIDEALDASFIAADAYARAARVEQVAKLLAEEDDPIVSSMAKAYADQLAGRLDLVRSPEAFRALEASVRRALAQRRKEDASRAAAGPRHARIQARPAGREQRAAMVAALIEFPELLGDDAVREELHLLEGESARVVAALAQCLRANENAEGRQITLDTAAFLGQMPGGIQAFAKRHLAAPVHGSLEEAKETLLMNASKLKDMLSRDASEVQREMKQAEDWSEQVELARELLERSQRARGIKG